MSRPEIICLGAQASPRRLRMPPGTYRCDVDGEQMTGIVEDWVDRVGNKHYWWACPVEEECLAWIADQSPEWLGYSCQGCPVWERGREIERALSELESTPADCPVVCDSDEAG